MHGHMAQSECNITDLGWMQWFTCNIIVEERAYCFLNLIFPHLHIRTIWEFFLICLSRRRPREKTQTSTLIAYQEFQVERTLHVRQLAHPLNMLSKARASLSRPFHILVLQ